MESGIKGYLAATWKMSFEGVKKGAEVLQRTGDVHMAVVEAVKAVEDDENFVSVGYGGLPNRDGEVELDAAYMDGDTLGAGAVMAVKNIRNPIEAARLLSRYQRNCILAGSGAEQFAERNGLAFCNLLTEKTRLRFEMERKLEQDLELLEAYEGHDTVCVIGRNAQGSMACGVSTSGLYLKHPGRIGDSPVIGSGFYADSGAGSAAATGVGEDIMKGCLSFAIVERMRMGMDVQTACETVLQEHIDRLEAKGHKPGSMSVIAMDRNHCVGASTTKEAFPFVVYGLEGGCGIYIASNENKKIVVFKPDQTWLDQYGGD